MKHLTDEQLSARLDGELPAKQAEEAERHLAGCAACRERLAALAGADASLARALDRDPGEAYFEGFAARVQARIASGAAADAAREAPADAAPRRGWFTRPATLAWAGAAASLALVGVFAVQFALQQSPGGRPVAASRSQVGILEREGQSAPPASQPAPSEAPASEPPAADEAAGSALTDARASAPAEASRDAAPTPPAAASRENAKNEAGARRDALAPQRLQELRTLPSGEQVPVQTQALPGAEKRRSFAVPPADASRPRKPVALPMAPQEQLKQVVTQEEATAARLGAARKEKAPAAPAPAASPTPVREAESFAARREADEAGPFRLCGTVTNAQGRALEGATVTVVETGRSVVSGAGGAFCVDAPAANATLSVLALGYHEYRASVKGKDAAPLAVSLRSVETVGPGGAVAGRLKTEPAPVAQGGAIEAPEAAAKRSLSGPTGATKGLYDFARPAQPAPDAAAARAASAAARLAKSATLWTKAATLWSAVAASAAPGPAADEARFHVAEARMSAWRLAPAREPRDAALAALEAFLASAPEGARRDTALAWRRELPAR